MHVIANGPQVAISAAINGQSLVAAGEEVTAEFMANIEAFGVNAAEPLHAGNQVRFGRLQHEMKMVAHQTKRMKLPIGLATGFGEGLQEQSPVGVGAKDVLALVATVEHMINGAGIFNSKFPGHTTLLPPAVRQCQ